jgi:hypothetical protein
MTPEEYADVKREIASSFPAWFTWFQKQQPPIVESIRKSMMRALIKFTYEEVVDTIEEISSGERPKFGSYNSDLENVPAFLRRAVQDHKQENQKDREPDEPPRDKLADEAAFTAAFSSMEPDAWTAISKQVAAGVSVADATVEVFGPIDETKEKAFKCRTCKDTGVVRVWRQEAVKACLAGVLRERRDLQILGSLPCSCEKGIGRGKVKFDCEGWALCWSADPHTEESLKELETWVEAKLKHHNQQKDHRQEEMFR